MQYLVHLVETLGECSKLRMECGSAMQREEQQREKTFCNLIGSENVMLKGDSALSEYT